MLKLVHVIYITRQLDIVLGEQVAYAVEVIFYRLTTDTVSIFNYIRTLILIDLTLLNLDLLKKVIHCVLFLK